MKNKPNFSKENLLSYFEERFGIKRNHFSSFEFYEGEKGRICIGPRSILPSISIHLVGISLARTDSSIKPSSNSIQLLGKYATKNTLLVTKKQALSFLKGEDITIEKNYQKGISDGAVIVIYSNIVLGCGLLKEGSIKSTLQKAKRTEVMFL